MFKSSILSVIPLLVFSLGCSSAPGVIESDTATTHDPLLAAGP